MLLAGETLVLVLVDTADVRGAAQAAVEVIGPGMVGAADHALHFTLFLHQLHAAVTADVMEHLHQAFAVAHQQQWQAHEVDRLDRAILDQVAGETDAGPGLAHDLIALQFEVTLLGVELIAKPGGLVDRIEYAFQLLHRNTLRDGVGHCCSPLQGTVADDRQARWPKSVGSECREPGDCSTNDFYRPINDFFSQVRIRHPR